jgi:hypothetical protein
MHWDGRASSLTWRVPEALAEGDAIFVSADPRHCVLVED